MGAAALDQLNDLIEAVVDVSESALAGASVATPTAADALQSLFPTGNGPSSKGLSAAVPVPPPRVPAPPPPAGGTPTTDDGAAAPPAGGPPSSSSAPPMAGRVRLTGPLADELAVAFGPGGPASDLTAALETVASSLEAITERLAKLRFRGGRRLGSLAVKVER